MKPFVRHASVIGYDLSAVAAAWVFAYWLRFNFAIPPVFAESMQYGLLWIVPVFGVVLLFFRVYRGMWRYVGVKDLKQIILATGLAILIVSACVLMIRIDGVPRSVLILQPLLAVMAMGGGRFAYRVWREYQTYGRVRIEGAPVLILGAGDAALALLRELRHSHQWRVVGLLDDGSEKQGRFIDGIPVLGPLNELPKYADRLDVRRAIIAMPSASTANRRRVAEIAATAGLEVLTVPALEDMLAGRVSISQVRRVELEDLLGRNRVELDDEGLHRLLTDKVVMVTGAGGSIGSELCRQIVQFAPKLLVFYELSEYALYAIEQEFSGKSIRCVIGDVKDADHLDSVFAEYRPAVVFHAAAYKHVPMMENDNAWQAVRNNVLGTLCVARAAGRYGTHEFVLISTDKAVNPTNVMGASKRLAELVCQTLQVEWPETRYVIVRFGNVLGSSGSVIPKFREQIARGGPITVTHPEIIRYFMLIPEAAQLVLQAGLMATMGIDGGKIFVLDMGEPVKIADLARDMIRLSGLTEKDIRIEYTGLRPGEKLYEELLANGESTLPTSHPKLRLMMPATVPEMNWLEKIETWLDSPVRSQADVKSALHDLIPEYRPNRMQ